MGRRMRMEAGKEDGVEAGEEDEEGQRIISPSS